MCPQRPWIIPQNIPLEQQALKKKQKNNRLQYFANFSFSCSQQRNWLHLITSYDEKFHKECGSKFTTNWQLHKPSNWTLFSLLPFLTWREFLFVSLFWIRIQFINKNQEQLHKRTSNRSNGIETAKDKQKWAWHVLVWYHSYVGFFAVLNESP